MRLPDFRVAKAAAMFAVGMIVMLLAATTSAYAGAARQQPLIVFAAASLKTVLDGIAASYQRETGTPVAISYAGSSALAKQIEQAAPADVFVSADRDWIDYLAGRGLLKAGTRIELLGNALALIAPRSPEFSLSIGPGFALADRIGAGRLALADTKTVPAGKYAKTALMHYGIWDQIAGKVAETENVRAALALVAGGEAPLGIVYHTDAVSEPNVRIVDTFPDGSHAAIVYPAAIIASTRNAEIAQSFLTYLRSSSARTAFSAAGFKVLAQ